MKIRMKPDTLGEGSSAARLQTAGFMIVITYMSIMLKMIRRLKWKMLAMPSANARTMQSTPVLDVCSAPLAGGLIRAGIVMQQ